MERVSSAVTVDVQEVDWSEFLGALSRTGFFDFATCFPPWLVGTHNWAAKRECCSDRLRALVDLLLLGRVVRIADVPELLVRHLDPLERLGILVRLGARECVCPSLALVCFFGIWLWVQRPQRNPTLYIGHDTYGLLARLNVRAGHTVIDLCSGPGTQGIYMARQGALVTAIEVNPVAAEVARVNVAMNGVQGRMEVYVGDLFEPVSSASGFELVTANPPLLPFPSGSFYPFVGHGGEDGLELTWRILRGLPKVLSDTGRAQIIGATFSDGFLPIQLDALESLGREEDLDFILSIAAARPCHRGSPLFEGLVATATRSASEGEETSKRLEALLQTNGATHMVYFHLLACRGRGHLQLIDLAGSGSALWFA